MQPTIAREITFHHLQSRITGLEHDIADRREFYNDAVNVNNVGIEQFPDLFIAKLFDFRTHEVLLFEAAEKTDIDLRVLFQTP
ncbi:MAG: LemA family protein [Gammaproteobacteria bacterium]